jgi:alpha-glucosidase
MATVTTAKAKPGHLWAWSPEQRQELAWWQRGVLYQVYPRSFQDSDNDGVGDLPGLRSQLDHIDALGVSAVWLAPVQPSPMAEFGYDIADFTGVDPRFGSLEDLDRLIEELHRRKLKLLMDFVPNHTSEAHPWFVDSRSSRASPKRDWYLWCDPAPEGGPPNNWLSRFGGSAWQFDERTGQYYYHAFLKEQPDLNWHNPLVRAAMAEVLRFWLRRGVDGFRVDAAAVLGEALLLRDDPPNPEFDTASMPPAERLRREYTDDRPETLDYLAELREVVDEFPDRVLLGEVDTSTARVAEFYGDHNRRRLDLPLNYRLAEAEWDGRNLRETIESYLGVVPAHAWPCWGSGSHDKPRLAGRIGPEQARLAAMLLLTLPGTVILYAGDEIGIGDVAIPPDRIQDPFERRLPGYGLNRDPSRTPMRWNAGPQAGFTTGEPWLPIGDDLARCNVSAQGLDCTSLLALYRRLIALRNRNPRLLAAGSLGPLEADERVLTYRRRSDDGEAAFVAFNLGSSEEWVPFDGPGTVLASTSPDRDGLPVQRRLHLGPNEGVVVLIEA